MLQVLRIGICTDFFFRTLNLQFPWERQIQTHVMNDGIIYKDQIDYDKPCVIMVCLKLGSSSFNKKYLKSLQYLCLSEFFSGIIGGHPRSSLFFIGCEGTSNHNDS